MTTPIKSANNFWHIVPFVVGHYFGTINRQDLIFKDHKIVVVLFTCNKAGVFGWYWLPQGWWGGGLHKCQFFRIIRESPGYRTNLPLSHTGQQISWIQSKILKIWVFILILANFGIFDTFLGVNQQCSMFNSIFRIEERYLEAKIGGPPEN